MNGKYRRERKLEWLALAAVAVLLLIFSAHGLPAQESSRSPAAPSDTKPSEPARESSDYEASLPRGKKLILTDGSYQIVREYERQDERVRYYSVERSSWEEIPADMVDWVATEKAGAEATAERKETLDRIHAATASEVAASIDTGSSLQVGSGEFLPDSPGVYVLDDKTVLGLSQVLAESHIDKGRAILKGISGMPFISSKQIIEVPGKRAKVRIHSAEPEFFFRTADGRSPNVKLVKATIEGDKRHVTTAVIDMVGTTKYDQDEIPVLASEAARGVNRLVVNQKLEPGEYALLETTDQGLSSYVWEFGVDTPGSGNNSKTKKTAAKPK